MVEQISNSKKENKLIFCLFSLGIIIFRQKKEKKGNLVKPYPWRNFWITVTKTCTQEQPPSLSTTLKLTSACNYRLQTSIMKSLIHQRDPSPVISMPSTIKIEYLSSDSPLRLTEMSGSRFRIGVMQTKERRRPPLVNHACGSWSLS